MYIFVSRLVYIAAQSEHELSGAEDPSILHAYIAYLPSRIAYREGENLNFLHSQTSCSVRL